MQTYQLIAHPLHPPLGIRKIEFACAWKPHWLTLRFRIEQAGTMLAPPFAGRARADELWRSTCFEIFVKTGEQSYCEFNFSPSEQWAAYDFAAYREGMTERAMPLGPVCTLRRGGNLAIFDAAIPADALPALPALASASAVIEEDGGEKSYWALHHPDPQKPDFHQADCFTLQLAPPEQT